MAELNDLLQVARANGMTREKIRREFPKWDQYEKNQFLDSLRWEIIQTTNKNNHSD